MGWVKGKTKEERKVKKNDAFINLYLLNVSSTVYVFLCVLPRMRDHMRNGEKSLH